MYRYGQAQSVFYLYDNACTKGVDSTKKKIDLVYFPGNQKLEEKILSVVTND
jgi:hypothetical protein